MAFGSRRTFPIPELSFGRRAEAHRRVLLRRSWSSPPGASPRGGSSRVRSGSFTAEQPCRPASTEVSFGGPRRSPSGDHRRSADVVSSLGATPPRHLAGDLDSVALGRLQIRFECSIRLPVATPRDEPRPTLPPTPVLWLCGDEGCRPGERRCSPVHRALPAAGLRTRCSCVPVRQPPSACRPFADSPEHASRQRSLRGCSQQVCRSSAEPTATSGTRSVDSRLFAPTHTWKQTLLSRCLCTREQGHGRKASVKVTSSAPGRAANTVESGGLEPQGHDGSAQPVRR